MKITGIRTTPIRVPIVRERATRGARGFHTESPFLIVEIETDEGITGLGEVSCTPGWSGEDQVTAHHLITTYLEPLLVGQDPRHITALSAVMHHHLANNAFTKSGIEMALWDIVGKAANMPVSALIGGNVRDAVRTKYSVSGQAPDRSAEIALWAVDQGFDAMKVKVGLDPVEDLARVTAVRQAIGYDVLLGVDANGGWDPATAVRLLPALADLGIAFVEQPVPAGDPQWMVQVRAASSLPIIADESISTAYDAMALARVGAADVFSAYMGMGGGIAEAVRIGTVASAARLKMTIGSNLELGIAQAAMIHVATSQPAIDPAYPCDIISRFFYEDDIVAEPLPVTAGHALAISRPGLGVELDPDAIARFRVR